MTGEKSHLAVIQSPPIAQTRSMTSDGMVVLTQAGELLQIEAYDCNIIRPRFDNYIELREYEQAAELALQETIMSHDLLVQTFERLPMREGDEVPPVRILFRKY